MNRKLSLNLKKLSKLFFCHLNFEVIYHIDVTAISVELLVLKLYCESERILFLFTNFIIFSAMIFSNIFENVGSRERVENHLLNLEKKFWE